MEKSVKNAVFKGFPVLMESGPLGSKQYSQTTNTGLKYPTKAQPLKRRRSIAHVAYKIPEFHSVKRRKLPDFQSSLRMHMGIDFGGTYIKFKL